MFISHKYKFIFIKTRKTGGSSIEKFFVDLHKPNEYIFAGMSPENMCPHNLLDSNDREHSGWKYILKKYPQEWCTYYKFTVERNPWDKVVSLHNFYKVILPKKAKPTFKEFLTQPKKFFYIDDWNLYTDNGNVVVDRILQYKVLHQDFKSLCYQIGIPYNNELQTLNLKRNFRNRKIPYQDYYDNELKKIVNDYYNEPIKYFNYQFKD